MRTPLMNGTTIYLNEIGTTRCNDVTIEEMIGMGGSCIVYTAVYLDAEGNRFSVRLKELYPEWIHLERKGNTLIVPEDQAADFSSAMQQFTDGYQKQMQFREQPESMNSIANIQGIYEGNGTKYIAMSCQNAVPFPDDLSLYDILRVVRAVTLQIVNFHDNGYLYLDLKPQNVMLYPETPEMVMLFDFDSAMPADDFQPAHLSCTDAWAAPEVMLRKYHEIGAETDIYGIGALLLYLLFHRAPAISDRRRGASWNTEMEAGILKTEKPEIKRIIAEIFSHTLAANPKKRYVSCDDLLDVIEPLIAEYQKPKPYLKTFLPMGNNFFCGRAHEIDAIHETLKENHLLILHGIGGIGKSELAKHYAQSYSEEYDAVVFVRFQGTIRDAVVMDSNFPVANCSRSDEEDDAAYFERKIKVLHEICTSRHLIILDNFDTDDCDNLDALTGLPCRILITSRVDYADTFPQYEVDVLDSEEAQKSIITYYCDADLDDADSDAIDNIISAVQGHTMALELIGKHMTAMQIAPAEMYDMLSEQGITAGKDGKVRGFKDGSLKNRAAYGHIAVLFNIFGLSEEMKQILRYEALIGSTPISVFDFGRLISCTEEQGNTLEELVALGWIQSFVVDEMPILLLHPLIADVLCEELKPDVAQCEEMMINAAGFAEEILDHDIEERKKQILWLNHIAHTIHGYSTAITFFFHYMMENILLPENDFENVEWYSHRIIQILDHLGLQEEYRLAYLDSYIHLIRVAESKGDAALAAQYEQKIADLKTPEALIELASERCKDAYEDDRLDAAEAAGQEWLELSLQAKNYENAAHAHYQLGLISSEDTERSRAHFQESARLLLLWISELLTNEDSLEDDLIHAYTQTGLAYKCAADYPSSVQYYKKAIDLTMEEHCEQSGKLIFLYTDLSATYHEMNDVDSELSCLDQAVQIAEYVYGRYDEITADCYLRLMEAYPEYEDETAQRRMHEKRAEISEILIEIYTKLYGENSDEVRAMLKGYVCLLELLDRKEDCIRAVEKLISLYEALDSEPDAEIIDSYIVAGSCYWYYDENEKAKKLLNKAAEMSRELQDDKLFSECEEMLAKL